MKHEIVAELAKKYLDISYSPEKIAEMLTLIGLEVEGIEKVESIKGGLKGVVTGEVVTCEKHPDADRLSLTTVDIGTGSICRSYVVLRMLPSDKK